VAHALNEKVDRRSYPPDLGWVFKN
jgi:hypothetical protein